MLRPKMEKFGLTVPEAAAPSWLGQTSIYKAIREGQLRIRKYGARTIITRDDLVKNLPMKPKGPRGDMFVSPHGPPNPQATLFRSV